METTVKKIDLNILKSDINNFAERQKVLRNFRKTVNFKGSLEERNKMQPWEAALTHHLNRQKLRIMYAALWIMRGKDLALIDKMSFKEEHELNAFKFSIDLIIKKYSVKVKE